MTKKISRNRTRKILFQMLYANSFATVDKSIFLDSFFEWRFEWDLDEKYLDEMLSIIKEHESVFLGIINKFAPKFKIEEMRIEYILPVYISAAEMLYLNEEIPAKVSINEAIELCKKYSDDSARKIVNWILNNLLKNFDNIKSDLDWIKYWNYSIFIK